MNLPLTITKKELRSVVGCSKGSRHFRTHIVTDHVITDVLGISIPDYNRLRSFDVEKTRRLLDHLKITPEHFRSSNRK